MCARSRLEQGKTYRQEKVDRFNGSWTTHVSQFGAPGLFALTLAPAFRIGFPSPASPARVCFHLLPLLQSLYSSSGELCSQFAPCIHDFGSRSREAKRTITHFFGFLTKHKRPQKERACGMWLIFASLTTALLPSSHEGSRNLGTLQSDEGQKWGFR